jgi:NADPH:quinone reductase-like Zn-dependent oxidoreductase
MKAIRFHQHGGPEVLKYEDAPDPRILANEVLVKVKACARNKMEGREFFGKILLHP